MGYASKEALVEYTQESKSNSAFASIFGGIMLVGGVLSLGTPLGIVLSLIFIVGGIYFISMGTKSNSNYKKFLSIASSTGELQRILNDFASSQSMADDRIRLGAEYIYGKKMGRPVQYTELRKVYPHIVSGSSCARYLKGVTADGQEHNLCEFIVKTSEKTPHPDESAIYQCILARNPNVHLGYK